MMTTVHVILPLIVRVWAEYRTLHNPNASSAAPVLLAIISTAASVQSVQVRARSAGEELPINVYLVLVEKLSILAMMLVEVVLTLLAAMVLMSYLPQARCVRKTLQLVPQAVRLAIRVRSTNASLVLQAAPQSCSMKTTLVLLIAGDVARPISQLSEVDIASVSIQPTWLNNLSVIGLAKAVLVKMTTLLALVVPIVLI